MGSNKARITVIVSSFNYIKYLPKTIESILNQTYHDFEVLVVDDGSSDGSREYIRKVESETKGKIQLVEHEGHLNRGLSKSLILGLSKAKGDWIAFLESDDFWDEDCLKKRIEYIDRNASVGILVNAVAPVFEDRISSGWFESYYPRIRKTLIDKDYERLREDIIKENLIPTFSSVMVKKEVILSCSFETPVQKWLDWFCWIQAFQKTGVVFLDEKLTFWRFHRGSYNQKKKLFCYFDDYKIFRQEVKQVLKRSGLQSRKIMLIVNTPALFFIIRRLVLGMKEIGVKKMVIETLRRFN